VPSRFEIGLGVCFAVAAGIWLYVKENDAGLAVLVALGVAAFLVAESVWEERERRSHPGRSEEASQFFERSSYVRGQGIFLGAAGLIVIGLGAADRELELVLVGSGALLVALAILGWYRRKQHRLDSRSSAGVPPD
jgi:Flp pilus assembly protein TadB